MDAAGITGPGPARARRGRPPVKGLAQRRQQQIVESAYAVFTEQGYGAASISAVAKHAGVGQGTVYRYFDSKRALLDHVVDYGFERLIDAVRAARAGEPPASAAGFESALRAIGERLFALIDEEPALLKLVLVEASAIDEELKARLLGLERALSAMMASYLDYGVREGWLRKDLNTAAVAHGLNALIVPGFLLALRGEATEDRRARYVDTLASLAMRGLRR